MFSYIRKAKNPDDFVVVVLNFKPVAYHQYRVGVPMEGEYVEILNSDRDYYHGSNQYNGLPLVAKKGMTHGKPYYIEVTIPPYGATIFKYRPLEEETEVEEGLEVELA